MSEDLDAIMDQWHALADLLANQNNADAHFNDANMKLVNKIHQLCLADDDLEKFESAVSFAEHVVDLRKNEKAWSRRLGDVMIRAQDLLDSNEKSSARKIFDEFQNQCPWTQFREHAENQRAAMKL
jgi:hypothetical protein